LIQARNAHPIKKTVEKKKKVLGNLSVIVGPNRKGEIIVRVGDDLPSLVRNFIALYGLKKTVYPTILEHLTHLISKKNPPKTEN